MCNDTMVDWNYYMLEIFREELIVDNNKKRQNRQNW